LPRPIDEILDGERPPKYAPQSGHCGELRHRPDDAIAHQQDGRPGPPSAHHLGDRDPIRRRNCDLRDECVDLAHNPLADAKGVAAASRLNDAKAFGLERPPDGAPSLVVVVDEEDRRAL
jgi:hypothetical protein